MGGNAWKLGSRERTRQGGTGKKEKSQEEKKEE